jgi:hypothetical protein
LVLVHHFPYRATSRFALFASIDQPSWRRISAASGGGVFASCRPCMYALVACLLGCAAGFMLAPGGC